MPTSVNSTSSLLDSGLPDFVTKGLAGMARPYNLCCLLFELESEPHG
jgi:hypothetical protein